MKRVLMLIEMEDDQAEFNSEAMETKVNELGGRLCDYEFVDDDVDEDNPATYEVSGDTISWMDSFVSW